VEDVQYLRQLCIKGTKDVVLIEMTDSLGRDIGKSTRWTMMREMKLFGIKSHTNTKALEITPEGVVVEMRGEEKFLEADSVILAVGSKSENSLEREIKSLGIPYVVVGDAKEVAQAIDAIHQGFRAGVSI